MKLQIYTIRDTKTEIYNTPLIFAVTHGEAERNFRDLANDQQGRVSKHPEDYDLYYLGVYDDQTASFQLEPNPKHIMKAIDAK